MRARFAVAVSVVSSLCGSHLPAQAALRPISSYLAAVDSGDVSALRYVARRCTALFVLIKNNLEERGDTATAVRYERAGTEFLTLASSAERKLGSSKSNATASTQRAIEDIARILMDRMRTNMASTGSYYAEDDLLRSDIGTCSELSRRSQ